MKLKNQIYKLVFRTKVIFVAAVLSVTALVPANIANAKAQYDLRFFGKNDIFVYNPKDVGCPATLEEGELFGSDNEEKTWNFLIQKALTPEQASGVMGNLSHDSGMRTTKLNDNEYGIAAWKGNAQTTLAEAAEKEKKEQSDLSFQLEYLYNDLSARKTTQKENSSYSNIWDGLVKQKKVDDALIYFYSEFEAGSLLDFDKAADTTEYKNAKDQAQGREYENSKQAIIGERGGYASSAGIDPNGRLGAQYFFKTYGEEKKSECFVSSGGQAVHPIVDGDIVWEGYGGPRIDLGNTYCGGVKWHNGYDLNGANNSTPVLSSMNGTVTSIDTKFPSLNTVSITHSDGFRIRYMHMNDGHIDVKVGDVVTAGQKIGLVGTGNGTYGAHLHVEIDVAGNKNPAVAALHANNCGIKSVNPNLFYQIFGVKLCPKASCDNRITEV